MRARSLHLLSSTILLALYLGACQPVREFIAGEAGNVELVGSEDAQMNEAIRQAQESLDVFIRSFQSPAPTQTHFSIKVRFPYGAGSDYEHMWLDDISFDGEHFGGTLANEPVYVSGLHLGDQVTARIADISDWEIVDDGRLLGGFTIHVLRNRMTAEERRQFDEQTGLVIGDRPELP